MFLLLQLCLMHLDLRILELKLRKKLNHIDTQDCVLLGDLRQEVEHCAVVVAVIGVQIL